MGLRHVPLYQKRPSSKKSIINVEINRPILEVSSYRRSTLYVVERRQAGIYAGFINVVITASTLVVGLKVVPGRHIEYSTPQVYLVAN